MVGGTPRSRVPSNRSGKGQAGGRCARVSFRAGSAGDFRGLCVLSVATLSRPARGDAVLDVNASV